MRFSDIYEEIILKGKHPGLPRYEIKPAAVSFLLTKEEKPSLLAIEKAVNPNYTWAGQVALPGGHVDPDDNNSTNTALRELEEELNISPDEVELIGSIGHFMTLNNVCIEVIAGWWNRKSQIKADSSEIARVLDIPIKDLLKTHKDKKFYGRDPEWTELLYPVDDTIIWGATARIIHHFIECLLSALPYEEDAF